MPEEIEVPTEHLHETVNEAAHESAHAGGYAGRHGKEGHEANPFNMRVAITTALLAVVAAIAALLAGHAANEALLEQIEASNEWNHFQSKSIKAAVLSSKVDLLSNLGKPASDKDKAKLAEYDHDMEELTAAAKHKEAASSAHMQHHVVLARAVTLFQIAIALAAIAVLTKKSGLWLCSLGLGVIGVGFFVTGLI